MTYSSSLHSAEVDDRGISQFVDCSRRTTWSTNTNGDGAANITDATYLLNHLFAGSPPPVAPFPDCGPGTLPADAELGCANPPACLTTP